MKIAIAQTKPTKGDIQSNIKSHLKFIRLASSNNANCIFFPELSLTGYEPELASNLAITIHDERLLKFQEICDLKKITIGLGAPTLTQTGIQISMLIFQPEQAMQTYSKQQLHVDEFPYFKCGDRQLILSVETDIIAPAICFESLQPEHAKIASELGAQIYVASVAKPQSGIDKAMLHYPLIASKYSMPVLMSNYVGSSDNFVNVGSSAVWDKQGNLLAKLDDVNEGLLIFDTVTSETTIHLV